ncbi:MAG TPA: hypothetical protein VF615_07240 [Longimicrobiaceae bacterium]|jgi:hypothetical protein
MSPISSKKTLRRLALGRETLRTLADGPAAAPAGFVVTSCGQECGCATIDQNADIKTF